MNTPPDPSPPPQERFDDRQPLVIGCLIVLAAGLVLGSAFVLGAWSVWKEQQPLPSPTTPAPTSEN